MSPTATLDRPQSAITARAVEFVAARRDRAEEIGRELAEEVQNPDAFAARLADGFRELADPDYHEGEHRIAPGLGKTFGVRWPLIAAVERGFRGLTKRESPTTWLFLADRLFQVEELEARWFAFGLLRRTVEVDPERTWQLLRRAAREAADWITVDTLAHPVGHGIAREAYRWAELEQLTLSPSRWERRLVGSTIATLPFEDRMAGRTPEVARHGLQLISELIGDAEPDVQKALSWAYRGMLVVDREATTTAIEAEAEIAAGTDDGHRAWVVRDTLMKLDPETADRIRTQLDGIRRRPGAPSTSRAAATSAQFAAMGLGTTMPEPPLT
ncbi:MAG TPA: DNA alkylation repair protein [Candidatus Polarisedimenticolia bacterium]|nr:DNA alkylation repair protein [Candidatus Polarisedimenticolia bacterium]